ncbi:MAG: AtpZ/AtpI family protein [Gracilimonas sp.]|nr:AtpZ/AtpI family protein [Gracilimonas sp.]MBO6615348.1 AtpZ/AtpI family protein [Gracilimonas sp.]
MSKNILPQKYMEYLGLGAEIAASLVIPLLAGYLLDKYFETSPIFILLGVLAGMIIFGLMIARINRKLNNRDND